MLEEFTTTTSVTTLLLLFLAAMIGIVASIGLSGTLSLNILERSREFGIMRSLGGTHKLINSMIRREGIFLCMLSWIVSILLSLPLTIGIGNILGPVLLGVPAHFQFSFIGLIFWFALSFIFSMIAGMLPCRHLNKMVTREVLSYE
jgi:putative ABC transport system permease protein